MGKLEATSPARKKRKTKLEAFLDFDFDNEIFFTRRESDTANQKYLPKRKNAYKD